MIPAETNLLSTYVILNISISMTDKMLNQSIIPEFDNEAILSWTIILSYDNKLILLTKVVMDN